MEDVDATAICQHSVLIHLVVVVANLVNHSLFLAAVEIWDMVMDVLGLLLF